MHGVSHDTAVRALVDLGRWLQARGYEFVTVTPETHRCVNARAERAGQALAMSLRDVFGWSRPFDQELLPPDVLQLLASADALEHVGPRLRSRVRFSSLGARLFVHSAFP